VFEHEGVPCRVEYLVACSSGWQTLHAKIAGWIGTKCVRLDVVSDSHHRWRLNGQECAAVDGCIDLDLEFSPATNVLPIRRLELPVGGRADLTSAWLRFPELTLEPLVQVYRHVSDHTYQYEALGGRFTTELDVSPSGMVLRYPELWEAERRRE
jgi:hypothetical protein